MVEKIVNYGVMATGTMDHQWERELRRDAKTDQLSARA